MDVKYEAHQWVLITLFMACIDIMCPIIYQSIWYVCRPPMDLLTTALLTLYSVQIL